MTLDKMCDSNRGVCVDANDLDRLWIWESGEIESFDLLWWDAVDASTAVGYGMGITVVGGVI